MTKSEQVANIITFLLILLGEDAEIKAVMDCSPDYIIEKYDRYVKSSTSEYPWGLHILLSKKLDRYVDKWGLNLEDREKPDE